MIVVDASMALSWVLESGENETIDSALAHVEERAACAPGNFQSEIVHALVQAERRGRIDAVQASAALIELLALRIAVELPDPHVTMAVAKEYRLTAYDAAYLALAIERQIPLATIDTQLLEASTKARLAFTSP